MPWIIAVSYGMMGASSLMPWTNCGLLMNHGPPLKATIGSRASLFIAQDKDILDLIERYAAISSAGQLPEWVQYLRAHREQAKQEEGAPRKKAHREEAKQEEARQEEATQKGGKAIGGRAHGVMARVGMAKSSMEREGMARGCMARGGMASAVMARGGMAIGGIAKQKEAGQ